MISLHSISNQYDSHSSFFINVFQLYFLISVSVQEFYYHLWVVLIITICICMYFYHPLPTAKYSGETSINVNQPATLKHKFHFQNFPFHSVPHFLTSSTDDSCETGLKAPGKSPSEVDLELRFMLHHRRYCPAVSCLSSVVCYINTSNFTLHADICHVIIFPVWHKLKTQVRCNWETPCAGSKFRTHVYLWCAVFVVAIQEISILNHFILTRDYTIHVPSITAELLQHHSQLALIFPAVSSSAISLHSGKIVYMNSTLKKGSFSMHTDWVYLCEHSAYSDLA